MIRTIDNYQFTRKNIRFQGSVTYAGLIRKNALVVTIDIGNMQLLLTSKIEFDTFRPHPLQIQVFIKNSPKTVGQISARFAALNTFY